MNTNPNFNNMGNFQNPMSQQAILEMRKKFRTKPAIKALIIFILGFLLMFVAWQIARGGENSGFYDTSIFVGGLGNTPVISLTNYAVIWMISMVIMAFDLVVILLLVKYSKGKVKIDVLTPTLSWVWLMIGIYALPNEGAWRWIIAPCFYIAAYIVIQIILVTIIMSVARAKLIKAVQEGKADPSLLNQMGGFGGNPNQFTGQYQKAQNPNPNNNQWNNNQQGPQQNPNPNNNQWNNNQQPPQQNPNPNNNQWNNNQQPPQQNPNPNNNQWNNNQQPPQQNPNPNNNQWNNNQQGPQQNPNPNNNQSNNNEQNPNQNSSDGWVDPNFDHPNKSN